MMSPRVIASVVFFFALIPEYASSHPVAGPIKQTDADAIIQKIISKDSVYWNTYADPSPGSDNPEFYVYEILAKDPRQSSQHVDFLQINRRTGEVWVVRGLNCYRYPMSNDLNISPVEAGPGVDLPFDCR